MQVITHLDLGGAEEVALSLCEQLADQFAFSVFAVMGQAPTPMGRELKERLERLKIPLYFGPRLDMKRGGMLTGGLALRRVLGRVRPDVLHLHTDIPEGAYAASRLFGTGKAGTPRAEPQLIRTIHNTTLWPRWQRVGRWVEGRLGGAALVGVSPASLEALHAFRARQQLAPVPAERTEVIYNGVAQPPATPLRQSGPARVLFAGRFEPQKGADLLPAILERAAQLTDAEAQISIYGHGSLDSVLRGWASSNPLRWPVTIQGPQPHLSARLPGYDVVMMPSRFEGLALTGLETLMAGTPLLAARIDGLRELFPAGQDEAMIAPEDVEGFAARLAQMIAEPQRWRDQAQNLIAPTAARFSLGGMSAAYAWRYTSLLSPAPATSRDQPGGSQHD